MMVRLVISKSAALEISGIAQYLKDELAPPGRGKFIHSGVQAPG